MNRVMTLIVQDERMYLEEGHTPKSRPLFVAPGLLIHCIGPLDGLRYQQATNLVLNLCEDMHIPALSLRRFSSPEFNKKNGIDTKSCRMKGF